MSKNGLIADAEDVGNDAELITSTPKSETSPKIVVRRNFPETFFFTDANFSTE